MAKKTQTIVTIIDDLDGTELTDAVEVVFGYKGTNYRMDLSKPNADKLDRLLHPYVEAAQKISGGRGRPKGTGTSRASTGSGLSKEELANIREWLRRNGHEVSERGRIKADLLALYDQAHAPAPTPAS